MDKYDTTKSPSVVINGKVFSEYATLYEDDTCRVFHDKHKGFSVFAVRDIVPGEVVCETKGGAVDKNEKLGSEYAIYCGQAPRYGRNATYIVEPQIPMAYINHSCTPNCIIHATRVPTIVEYVAIRFIHQGQEFTVDYGWLATSNPVRCLCGSLNCRKWIVAESELPKLKRLLAKRRRSR